MRARRADAARPNGFSLTWRRYRRAPPIRPGGAALRFGYGAKMLVKLMQILGLIVLAWLLAAVAAEAASRRHPPRGQMVDVGGRRLRLVCEGPVSARPTVWMEAGAFGGAADFAAIQERLTSKGYRSCAYDRAGMGYSDPGPSPRDGDAIAGDLEHLIAACGERGPFLLMAHSMGGLYVRQFAARNRDKVAGLVLIEAVTPELLHAPGIDRFYGYFHTMARAGAFAGTLGLTKPAYFFLPDKIGLPPEGVREKRRGFISGRQSRTALDEVEHWFDAAKQGEAAGAYDPAWPVAVVTASSLTGTFSAWEDMRRAPERASASGSYANVPAASHNSILGATYNQAVIDAVERVAQAARPAPASTNLVR